MFAPAVIATVLRSPFAAAGVPDPAKRLADVNPPPESAVMDPAATMFCVIVFVPEESPIAAPEVTSPSVSAPPAATSTRSVVTIAPAVKSASVAARNDDAAVLPLISTGPVVATGVAA
ncbi:hypothetical protein NOLU111490_01145 [Novosphingobium lubricantis]